MNIPPFIKAAGIVLLGNALYAFAVAFFIVPAGLILGGFTGLSIALNHFVHIKVSYLVLFFHLTVFLFGARFLGKQFALSTAASTFLYPTFLGLFERLFEGAVLPAPGMLPLFALAAAVCIGISLGLLTRNHTSTGGTEVIPLIIHKLTGRSVGQMLLLLDGAIMLIQLVYSDWNRILYGLLIVAVYSAIVHGMNTVGKKGNLPKGNANMIINMKEEKL